MKETDIELLKPSLTEYKIKRLFEKEKAEFFWENEVYQLLSAITISLSQNKEMKEMVKKLDNGFDELLLNSKEAGEVKK